MILDRLKIKRGNVYAQSLAGQSYWYRLGYVWLNALMLEDKRNTSLSPLKMSALDVVWVIYFSIMASIRIATVILLGWFKAYSMKDVKPIAFDWGGRNGRELSTSYAHLRVWYYDNGKVLTK